MDGTDGWLWTELRNHSPYDLCISPPLKSSSCVGGQSNEQLETGVLTYIYCVCTCHVYLWRGKDDFAVSSLFHLSWVPAMELGPSNLHHKSAAISEAGELGVFKKTIYKIDWKYTTLKENLTRVKASALKTIERAWEKTMLWMNRDPSSRVTQSTSTGLSPLQVDLYIQ